MSVDADLGKRHYNMDEATCEASLRASADEAVTRMRNYAATEAFSTAWAGAFRAKYTFVLCCTRRSHRHGLPDWLIREIVSVALGEKSESCLRRDGKRLDPA